MRLCHLGQEQLVLDHQGVGLEHGDLDLGGASCCARLDSSRSSAAALATPDLKRSISAADVGGVDVAVRPRRAADVEHDGLAEGNARRAGQAGQRHLGARLFLPLAFAHSSSPKRSKINCPSFSTASCRRGPVGLDVELGALRAAQQQHAHHALGVGGLTGAPDRDLAGKLGGELHQLGGGARVQTELVPDLERAPGDRHVELPPSGSPPLPAMVTRSTSR